MSEECLTACAQMEDEVARERCVSRCRSGEKFINYTIAVNGDVGDVARFKLTLKTVVNSDLADSIWWQAMNEEMLADYLKFTLNNLLLMIKKRHDYGTLNVTSLGVKGVFVRLWDKLWRLKNLLWEGTENAVKDETIDDTVRDLANYAFIMHRVKKRGRW